MLAASLVGGCAEDFPAGTAEQRGVGEASLESGVTVELVPGTASVADQSTVIARAAAPEPTLSISTLSGESGTFTIQIENVPAEAALRVTNIVERDAAVSPACPEDTAGQIRCDRSDDPRCEAPETSRIDGDPNTISLEWSQSSCLQTNFRIARPASEPTDAMHVGIVGRTADRGNTREALDRLAVDDPDFAFMLGDNAAGKDRSQLNRLADLHDSYDFPTYMLPGESETTPTSRTNFRAVFGPYDHNFEYKGTRFVLLYSAGGIIGSQRLFQLRSTLLRFSDQAPIVVVTHTPPIDPLGARNDGLLSEIEAARTLSILSEFGADLLITGHINDTHRVDARGVDLAITSAAEHGREVLMLDAPFEPESADELEIERMSLD